MTSSLHSSAVVVDALGGTFVPMPTTVDGVDYIDRLKNAGLTAVTVTLASKFASFDEAMFSIYDYELVWELHRDRLRQVLRPDDIITCKSDGKIGVLLGFQTGTPVGDDLRRVTILHKLGLRMMSLTYMEQNLLGGGCLEPRDTGLTHLGRQVVREMNRLGIIVDLSHVGGRTSLDAIEVSAKPAVFSHSGARALTDHPRNITDEAISAVAAKGGLVCVTPYGACISPDPANGVQATIADYVRHIRHAIDLVGVDHVGIGTDIFENKGAAGWNATTKRRYPESVGGFTRDKVRAAGLENMSKWPNITSALSEAGFKDDDVKKIVGGNFLRVFEAVCADAQ